VLDPFCGSGGTAVSALLDGRKAIAIDRSPAATFIAKNHCTPVDPDELRLAFEKVKRTIQPEIDWLYETRCDRCGGKATTGYTVYSQVFQCPRCLAKITLYDCGSEDAQTAAGKAKTVNVCPACQANGFTEVIRSQGEKFGYVPVKVVYHCYDGCKPTRDERLHNDSSPEKRSCFDECDLGKVREIESKDIPHWFPHHRMMNEAHDTKPWGDKWRAGTSNFRTVAELFTKRNLWALSSIRDAIKRIEDDSVRDALMFALSGIMLNTTKMCQDRGKLGFNKGTYYIPQVVRELVVTNSLNYKVENHLIPAFGEIADIDPRNRCISTQSSTNLSLIASNSIDYIFTDSPYADKVQYGKLNFIWEAWLDFDTTWHDEEIIVNEVRGKSTADWEDLMKKAMAECFRVLKPGRWLSLCYHDTSEGTWAVIQDVMAEVGFVIDKSESTLFIGTFQTSFNQKTADKTTKRDLVLNFRKPKVGEFVITRLVDGHTFAELGAQVIRDCLTSHPGTTKDRIYDALVSRMVQAGKMESHDFNALLRGVAEEVQEPVKENLFDNKEPDLNGTKLSVNPRLQQGLA
jgi:DNA modification methylase